MWILKMMSGEKCIKKDKMGEAFRTSTGESKGTWTKYGQLKFWEIF
jgi:hypothetical protein